MLSMDYRKGFNAGLNAGMRRAMRESIARTIMNKDLVYAYGCMAIVLQDRYQWRQDDIEKLIAQIQGTWTDLLQNDELAGIETMAELVERRTGIQLVQRVADIVDEDLED